MDEVLAELRLSSVSPRSVYISHSFDPYRKKGDVIFDFDDVYSKKNKMSDGDIKDLLLGKQEFVWYQDFMAFRVFSYEPVFWAKLATNEIIEIDSVLQKFANYEDVDSDVRVLILPFQIFANNRIYLHGGEEDSFLSFTLSAGHYKVLFQQRRFTTREIEASPNNDYEDLDLDGDLGEYIDHFCQITFIPTEDKIEPEFLIYKASKDKEKIPSLVLHDRKIGEQSGVTE